MPLQDLTPQLRTRLSRLERLVGLFVTLATLLMLAGLAYYIYQRAEHRGWFLRKMPYYTFVRDATGLKVGDKVTMMGFPAGEILEITPQPPEDIYFNVFVRFNILEPYYGYLWESSRARIASADFLGKRAIEVTKGTNGPATYLFREFKDVSVQDAAQWIGRGEVSFGEDVLGPTGFVAHASEKLSADKLEQIAAIGTNTVQLIFNDSHTQSPTGMWDDKAGRYTVYDRHTKGYWLPADESPALTERLEALVNLIETNVPNILDLTNKIADVLTNAASAAAHADELLLSARPFMTNLTVISAHLREPRGALGDWLLPTHLNAQLTQTLASANTTLLSANSAVTNTDARLGLLVTNFNLSLENLANITSNLHAQVEANSNLVTSVNRALIDADTFIQGLKRHWLLRSAFKEKATNAPPPRRITAPRDAP